MEQIWNVCVHTKKRLKILVKMCLIHNSQFVYKDQLKALSEDVRIIVVHG